MRPIFKFRNNAGTITEYSFLRHGAKFDFWLVFPCVETGQRRYFCYGETPAGWLEVEGAVLDQPLEPFRFLDRNWLKPVHHEDTLTAHYGDWRTPDPDWSFVDDLAIVHRRPWTAGDFTWR